jgi:Ca2+-binding EF-hand superfamily protein
MKKIDKDKFTTKELFLIVDAEGDNSGSINKAKFKKLTNRLSMSLSDHRIDEIFSNIKKSDDGNDDLNEEEFENVQSTDPYQIFNSV